MFDDIRDDNEHDIDVTIAQGRGDEDEAGVEDEPEEDERPRRPLTRRERLEALADAGTDTWEEYGSER